MTHRILRPGPTIALGAMALLLQLRAAKVDDDFFETKVRPVLAGQCYECHSASAKKVKGGLRVDSREALLAGGDSGPAVVPGDPVKSRLLRAVRHEDPDLAMPPRKPRLPDEVIEDLAAWVRRGASFPSGDEAPVGKAHWAFQPVRNPVPPEVKSEWPRTSVDDFILAGLRERGAEPAPAADKRSLLRRATYDLTGLPPTAAEIDAFENDGSPDAFARVVDRLLASPSYGEQWGRHWLDLARYADTAGETADYPVPPAWRYRNYVIDAFNADKPYDEFLREQIAGDILARRGPAARYAERVTATGYLAISRRFGFDSENYHHLTVQDTLDTLGQTVLGLSLGCARCHNHKFDPVSMKDYYALYGIFESTRYAFPGSEQKQKTRALVPLVPPEESAPRWRAFEARVAVLARELEQQRQPVPAAVLRSLDDLDGDFEMQAPAAGGSKGVLVPPWIGEGPLSVTTEAQSPFKNLHSSGRVGVSVAAGTNSWRIAQSLYPVRTRDSAGLLQVNLDFRVTTNQATASGSHRFWLGARESAPAVEVLLSAEQAALRAGRGVETICRLKPEEWYNLQLTLDLKGGTVSGTLGRPGELAAIRGQPLSPAWPGVVDFLVLDSKGGEGGNLPGLAFDNIGVQPSPLAPVSIVSPALAAVPNKPGYDALTGQLTNLAGLDGDFELQTDGTPPAAPWAPGPASVATIRAASQSPYRNIFARGERGVHLPGGGAYNGFGQTMTNCWKSDRTGRLFASFDFRCLSVEAGGSGSWRFYLGHGPGTSAAIELYFNDGGFFHRNADLRESVRSLKEGEWYQVQLALDLHAKSYTGSIATAVERTGFAGRFATGWDGSIDYAFIDSYGHVAGARPALDADNFAVGEAPLPPLDSPPLELANADRESRRRRVEEVRRQLAVLADEAAAARAELQELLAEGPVELAYAVGEGTPHNSRIQLRGDPEKPGEEAPRGFPEILGGGRLPVETGGSGRLELAEWLTRSTNPLTARVMVNRLWQYHFGQGLVKTPNDFGARGQPPSHPELLDHLATQFMRSGWSMKAMHRLIMLSATYQQAAVSREPAPGDSRPVTGSQVPGREDTNHDHGPDAPPELGESFSPFPRRRLSAEEIRDSVLLVSGELDPAPGRGHPFPAPTGWGFTQHAPFNAVYDHRRRSVYLMTQRIRRHPFLALFDGADPNASTAERRTTTVPTQALFFLNDPFVHGNSERFAACLQRVDGGETPRIEAAYRLALGRSPTPAERAEAGEFLAAYRSELVAAKQENVETATLAAFARVLFGSNEFLTVD